MDTIDASMESMLDMFIFETNELLEKLDEIMISSEQEGNFSNDEINEIFRIMHTIKGSSAMMGLDTLSKVAHKVEDMFFIIRDNPDVMDGKASDVFDIVFKSSDFMRGEIEKVEEGEYQAGDSSELMEQILRQKDILSGKEPDSSSGDKKLSTNSNNDKKNDSLYRVKVFFEADCQMENIRAVMLINSIKDWCEELQYIPSDIETNPDTCQTIIDNGFEVMFTPSKSAQDVYKSIETAMNVDSYELISKPKEKEDKPKVKEENTAKKDTKQEDKPQVNNKEKINKINKQAHKGVKQNLISVNLAKLDGLMDIVGEIVITQSMIANNPDLAGLKLERFNKATGQLKKLTNELQDSVMSIRMVEVSGVFQKMNRIVRDMNKKLNKNVVFETRGEDTEVDKTIIDCLSDPLMHIIRNSMDHGIEDSETRIKNGKEPNGKVGLSANSQAGEISIIVADDGQGLDTDKLLEIAQRKGLLNKPADKYTKKEIYNFIMMPGFSTNKEVTEFSGRGVGMDVVHQNIAKVGGRVSVNSEKGEGTIITIKIPLTLSIIDGMDIKVGDTRFTIPITSIVQTFKISNEYNLIKDNEGAEMIMVRGCCYPVIRLHKLYEIDTKVQDVKDGIFVLIESGDKKACIFADELVGEQEIVVKSFPSYLNNFDINKKGMSGCTILGDGSISLIIDVHNIVNQF